MLTATIMPQLISDRISNRDQLRSVMRSMEPSVLEHVLDVLVRGSGRDRRLLTDSFVWFARPGRFISPRPQNCFEITTIAVQHLSPSGWLWTHGDIDEVATLLEMTSYGVAPFREAFGGDVCAGMVMELSMIGKLDWDVSKWAWAAAHVSELEPLRGTLTDRHSMSIDLCKSLLEGTAALRDGIL